MRKTKATLLEQAIPLLEKMAKKGKGVTPEKVQARQAQVRGCLPTCCGVAAQHPWPPCFSQVANLAHLITWRQVAELKQTIEEISDGAHSARKPQKPFSNGGARSGEVTVSTLEMDGRYQTADYYTHTEQTTAFQQVQAQGQGGGCEQLQGDGGVWQAPNPRVPSLSWGWRTSPGSTAG
jgi:hypothetical protein